MDSYEAFHALGSLDFTNYVYYGVLVDGVATIQGNSITTTSAEMIPVAICKAGEVSGAGVLGLVGKKKPEATKTLNSDGTWSIK